MTSYPHEAWAKMMDRSPGVWYSLIQGGKAQDGLMRVMAHRIRTGELKAYAPAGTYDAVWRQGVLWGQRIETGP